MENLILITIFHMKIGEWSEIQIETSNLPNENRGIAAEDAPYSFSVDEK